jgi:hypothetical protein
MIFSAQNKSNTRFLVAKYIRDLHRLEPRNIGVIVWTDGAVSARFLGEGSGEVKAPRKLNVRDQGTYRQWIQYWREQMSKPALSLNGNGHQVAHDSPEFVDALRKKSKRQFVLVDGGFVTGEIDRHEIDDVVHNLFSNLVEDSDELRQHPEEDSILLKKSVSRVFRDSGIEAAVGYQSKLPLVVSVDSHPFPFTFDWGIYTKAPHALFQHAILTRPTTVNSAAFMFSCLARADFLPYRVNKNCRFALVRTTPAILDSAPARDELEKLKAYGTVIDVSDEERSIHDLRSFSLSL